MRVEGKRLSCQVTSQQFLAKKNTRLLEETQANLDAANREIKRLGGKPIAMTKKPAQLWKDKATLQGLVEIGATNVEMAAQLGCSAHTITKWLKKHAVKRSTPWRSKSQLKNLRLDLFLSDRDVANYLGCSPSTANRQRHAMGIDDSLASMTWEGRRSWHGVKKNGAGKKQRLNYWR